MGVIGCIIGSMLRCDTLQITPEILNLIARIDEFKGAWRALGTRDVRVVGIGESRVKQTAIT